MAVDTGQAVPDLLKAYSTSPDKTKAVNLNNEFRSALGRFAEAKGLRFSQDNSGNVYVVHSGRDSELSAIAIAFPLDEALSPDTFEGAFRTFNSLLDDDLRCDIALLGWTSIESRLVGREEWEKAGALFAKPAPSPALPQLEQFSELPDGSHFPLSAIFEVREGQGATVRISGSPVLVPKAEKNAPGSKVSISPTKSSRSPEVRIEGSSAVEVACVTVRDYSVYVAALFENFD